MTERKWVHVPGLIGWVREHDPDTESGLAPMTKEAGSVATERGQAPV